MGIGIGKGAIEEGEAELVPGELGAANEFERDEGNDGEDAEGAEQH